MRKQSEILILFLHCFTPPRYARRPKAVSLHWFCSRRKRRSQNQLINVKAIISVAEGNT